MDYTRQLDIIRPEHFVFPVTLIGCGGIGSPTAILLAKIGCPNLTLIDPDVVSEHNIPNQFFRRKDRGKYKVKALQKILSEFSACVVRIEAQAFTENSDISGIVISAVDTMSARYEIWQRVRYNITVPVYIDARSGGELLEVFTIRPCAVDDVELYEKFLYTDKEAMELPCTGRGVLYTGFVIAGIIAAQLAKFLKSDVYYKRVNFDLKTMTSVFQ